MARTVPSPYTTEHLTLPFLNHSLRESYLDAISSKNLDVVETELLIKKRRWQNSEPHSHPITPRDNTYHLDGRGSAERGVTGCLLSFWLVWNTASLFLVLVTWNPRCLVAGLRDWCKVERRDKRKKGRVGRSWWRQLRAQIDVYATDAPPRMISWGRLLRLINPPPLTVTWRLLHIIEILDKKMHENSHCSPWVASPWISGGYCW